MSLKHGAPEQQHDGSDEAIASDPLQRSSGVRARAERSSSAPPVTFGDSAPQPPLISIGSPADASLLEPTYAYLSAYCFACLSPHVAERINVAIYELLANALRYGSAAGDVRLELSRLPDGIALTVSNYAGPAQRERLERQIARVKQDAQAAFAAEMERFHGGSATPPMLGLVRVAHETKLDLELRLDGDHVQLTTACRG